MAYNAYKIIHNINKLNSSKPILATKDLKFKNPFCKSCSRPVVSLCEFSKQMVTVMVYDKAV